MYSNKIFIIGLPRTGTTSVCVALLNLGFRVAHTAYTENTFQKAQVIADTPIFADYKLLDKLYPKAKFIYLERDLENWLPSIQQLLLRMHDNLNRKDGGFNPIIKRCYQKVFSPYSVENINNMDFLAKCYQNHYHDVASHFENNTSNYLAINIANDKSYHDLLTFLNIPISSTDKTNFEKHNVAGKVTAWKNIKSALKVNSTNKGRVTKLPYYA